jgi:hypothetical protein
MKLTNNLLKKIIAEEVAKFGEMESTEDRAKKQKNLKQMNLALTML